jgi:hypothetical protein
LKLELAALKKSAENKEKAAGSRQGEGKSQPQDAFDRAWNDGT